MKAIAHLLGLLMLSGCSAMPQSAHERDEYAHYRHKLVASDVLSQPESSGNTFGYLFLTRKPDRAAVVNHRVWDNCRDAGSFTSGTFSMVKLLPGRHHVEVTYEPVTHPGKHPFRARYDFDIKGGEVRVFNHEMAWETTMQSVETDIDFLRQFHVSSGCVDCTSDPDPREALDTRCLK